MYTASVTLFTRRSTTKKRVMHYRDTDGTGQTCTDITCCTGGASLASLMRVSTSRASWQVAHGPRQQCVRQSPHGSSGRLYLSRIFRLPLAATHGMQSQHKANMNAVPKFPPIFLAVLADSNGGHMHHHSSVLMSSEQSNIPDVQLL